MNIKLKLFLNKRIKHKLLLIIFKMETVYFGESTCACNVYKPIKRLCGRKAYYRRNADNAVVCGYHSKEGERTKLAKNPMAGEIRHQELMNRTAICHYVAQTNKQNNVRGVVKCMKMKMFGNVPFIHGFINVFPNYKHGNRQDGLGLPSLSPKSIGPVEHFQLGLPIALNLENFHQGNKVFSSELDENGQPLPLFYETQRQMYLDPVPHRHKQASGKKNVPAFSIWRDKNGTEHKIDYFTSRQFYCNYYDRATKENKDYIKLMKMLEDGYNLMIVGYDGYEVTYTIEEHYKDITRPFGHELVLYTMLTCGEEDWPWRKWKTFDF